MKGADGVTISNVCMRGAHHNSRSLPDARLCILPDTDHMAIVRRADVVHPLVEAFLAGGAAAGDR